MPYLDFDAGILIGVSSGIACYKSVEVIRELQKRGYKNIETVLTKNTVNFLSPNLFEAITGKKPYVDVFEEGRLLSHIKSVEDKKVFAILPATANIIGKLANGIADDFLSTCYLAFKGKTLIFPSMNSNMYGHPAVKRNLEKLKKDGCLVVEPDAGYLACGYEGKGRLPDIETVADYVELYANKRESLKGKKVLITSGGTVEPIDSVRVITNRSSGAMGRELARFFSFAGADVVVITGNHTARYPDYTEIIEVGTVDEMYKEVMDRYDDSDIVVMAAAVSDFKVKNYSPKKIKKKEKLALELEKTTDILAELGRKKKGQVLVGFAAETDNVYENGAEKLKRKNLDLLIANKVGEEEGFGERKLKGFFIADKGIGREFEMSKAEVAAAIVEIIEKALKDGQ